MIQEMLFKRFLTWSSGSPPVQLSGTIYAILKEGIMGNIHVKLFEIWTSGSVKKKFMDDGQTTEKDDHNSSP